MSNAIEYAQNGNINGLQEEIRRNPNAVHVKSGVRVIIYIFQLFLLNIIIMSLLL